MTAVREPLDNDNLPDIGDAVLFDGDRFRIRDIDADGKCLIRPDWGDDRIAVDVNRLRWDREARAWRTTNDERSSSVKGVLRQGDVYLLPVKTIPAKVTPVARDAGRVVLAYGEVTGHAHAVLDPEATLLTTAENERFLRIVGSGVELVHEEHATITVAPGAYRVFIQEEWSDAMEPVRVVD